MASVISLVGRPNVGKSTLFNRLTGKRDALVANEPGLTRDRRYGIGHIDEREVMLVDTGGLSEEVDALGERMGEQVDQALAESDRVLFMVDARSGVTGQDSIIADALRRRGLSVTLVINKFDGVSEGSIAEFAELGFGPGFAISASHGRGLLSLFEHLLDELPAESEADAEATHHGIRVAFVGRPNVGKSTLVNRLLGENRVVVMDMPGTTRDAIEIPFSHKGRDYTLIDTAGIRRKGKVDGIAEKFSVVKSLDAMRSAEVSVLVIDAREGLVDQDLHLLKMALDAGSGVMLAVNKWDGLPASERDAVKKELSRRLVFAPWLKDHAISALHGTGVSKLMNTVVDLHRKGAFEVATSHINSVFEQILSDNPPPMARGRTIKLRFAHKAGSYPPRIAIHGSQTKLLPASYVRYLENAFRKAFRLDGVPIRIDLKTTENPYAGRRNELTPRQKKRQDRVRKRRR